MVAMMEYRVRSMYYRELESLSRIISKVELVAFRISFVAGREYGDRMEIAWELAIS